MLLVGFNDVNFVDLTIAGEIVMWFFVAIAILAFVFFLFNLVFIHPASRNTKERDPELVQKSQEFEEQKNEVEIEIALILRVEEEDHKKTDGHKS